MLRGNGGGKCQHKKKTKCHGGNCQYLFARQCHDNFGKWLTHHIISIILDSSIKYVVLLQFFFSSILPTMFGSYRCLMVLFSVMLAQILQVHPFPFTWRLVRFLLFAPSHFRFDFLRSKGNWIVFVRSNCLSFFVRCIPIIVGHKRGSSFFCLWHRLIFRSLTSFLSLLLHLCVFFLFPFSRSLLCLHHDRSHSLHQTVPSTHTHTQTRSRAHTNNRFVR